MSTNDYDLIMAYPSRASEEQIQAAARLVIAGTAYTTAARPLGVQGHTLKALMRNRGIEVPSRKVLSRPLVLPKKATDLAYIAGIIDGEGSLGRVPRKIGSWRICIYNTDKPLMDWLCSFGGLTYLRSPTPGAFIKSQKKQYGWHLNRRDAVLELILAVRPYLRIKAAAADEAIAELTTAMKTIRSPIEISDAKIRTIRTFCAGKKIGILKIAAKKFGLHELRIGRIVRGQERPEAGGRLRPSSRVGKLPSRSTANAANDHAGGLPTCP